MIKILLLILIFISSSLNQINAQDNASCNLHIEALNDFLKSDNQNSKDAKTIFKSIKDCAESGDIEAAYTLGILYKDGIGTSLNFNKAKKWFEKAFDGGSDKAAFSLGYTYLKGLGNIQQSYIKAIEWFEKSNYPMAKHWLAKCYYHGYGVEIDKEKALELLKTNTIPNSHILLAQWQYEFEHPEESEENYSIKMKDSLPAINLHKVNQGVFGAWIGEWRIMDWSGKKAERNIPIYLELTDNRTGLSDLNITLDGNEFKGNVIVDDSQLTFLDLTLSLKKRYTDNPNELSLDYRVANFSYSLIQSDETEILTGQLETTIQNWSEPGSPSQLILHREGTILSQEIKDALSEQKEHFIKVYPNPFEEDLLLYYTLEHDTNVLVNFYDYYNPQMVLKTKEKYQKKGERTISLNYLNGLDKGLYIVQMYVAGSQYSRIVIKK
tara:strand:+ start:102457 stop:103770 length:1314 start_codon:yes stop_codon:yes gene_type:complete